VVDQAARSESNVLAVSATLKQRARKERTECEEGEKVAVAGMQIREMVQPVTSVVSLPLLGGDGTEAGEDRTLLL